MKRPQIIAHRGASLDAPENTVVAFEEAIEQGADRLEFDVQLTADGVAVVHHDDTLARVTDAADRWPDRAPWALRDVTLEQLRELETRWPSRPRPQVCRIPTLAELLRAVEGRTRLLLELKAPTDDPALLEAVAADLRACPSWLDPDHPERLTVQSFDHAAVGRMRRLLPDHVPAGWVVDEDRDLAALAVPGWVRELVVAATLVDERVVAVVRAAGRAIHAWTVNDVATIRHLAALGVDGIITDAPGVARRALAGVTSPSAVPGGDGA